MKTYACMLCRNMSRMCGVVLHKWFKDENYKNLMHIVCSFTLGYFPFYDDEYGRVHYDDNDHHALHDIRGFVVFSDV